MFLIVRSATVSLRSFSTVRIDHNLGYTVKSMFISPKRLTGLNQGSHVTFLVLNSGLLLLIYFFVKLVSILCHVTPSRDLNLVILQKSLCSNMAVTLNITYLLIPIYLKLHNGPFLIQSKKYPNVQSYSRDLRHVASLVSKTVKPYQGRWKTFTLELPTWTV